jgi:hypothetical protein
MLKHVSKTQMIVSAKSQCGNPEAFHQRPVRPWRPHSVISRTYPIEPADQDGANATALLYGNTVDFSAAGVQNTATGVAYTFGNSAIFTNTTNVGGNPLSPEPAGVGGQTQ